MLRIERKVLLCVALVIMAVSACAVASPVSVTIASFSDPSDNSDQPLFTIDYLEHTINGSWLVEGLKLEVRGSDGEDIIYDNAVFEMDSLDIPDTVTDATSNGYYTEPVDALELYSIRFYELSDDIRENEILKIEFNRIWIGREKSGLYTSDATIDKVTITGIGIGVVTNEIAGFTFANRVEGDGDFNATASFTSSATPAVPEPATMAILALGGLMLRRRRK
jgi:hypothetical protein